MPATEQMLQIGEVAERVELSLRTVRYYEEMGLREQLARAEELAGRLRGQTRRTPARGRS